MVVVVLGAPTAFWCFKHRSKQSQSFAREIRPAYHANESDQHPNSDDEDGYVAPANIGPFYETINEPAGAVGGHYINHDQERRRNLTYVNGNQIRQENQEYVNSDETKGENQNKHYINYNQGKLEDEGYMNTNHERQETQRSKINNANPSLRHF